MLVMILLLPIFHMEARKKCNVIIYVRNLMSFTTSELQRAQHRQYTELWMQRRQVTRCNLVFPGTQNRFAMFWKVTEITAVLHMTLWTISTKWRSILASVMKLKHFLTSASLLIIQNLLRYSGKLCSRWSRLIPKIFNLLFAYCRKPLMYLS